MKIVFCSLLSVIGLFGCKLGSPPERPSTKMAAKADFSIEAAQTPATGRESDESVSFDPNEDPTPNDEYIFKNTATKEETDAVSKIVSVLNKIRNFGPAIGLSTAMIDRLLQTAKGPGDQSTILGKLMQQLDLENPDSPLAKASIEILKKLVNGDVSEKNAIEEIGKKIKELGGNPLGVFL